MVKMPEAIAVKLRRLQTEAGSKPRVLDLFSGCGGLSLGFQAAGFEIAAAVEIDPFAARSHALNFAANKDASWIEEHSKPIDITKVDPDQLAKKFEFDEPSKAFDVIVGGPPCQAYARVGRAKLREVAEHPQAFKVDPRANLYLRYLQYVKELQPLALLMENVPDILNHGGHNIVQEMVEALSEMGYEARYSLINSSHHGVPQMRDRVFMIAVHKSLNAKILFPKATHYCALPTGYQGTRAVALKLVNLFGGGYVQPDTGNKDLPKAISTKDALGDLAPITTHLKGLLKRGARRFDELSRYRKIEFSKLPVYAQEMRSWPNLPKVDGVFDHVIRYLPRDANIFAAMQPGDEYPSAHLVAIQLFEAEARKRKIKRDSAEWKTLFRAMVPPYDPGKFPNRWWKLRPDKPSRTLLAHMGKDTYSHIHYDSSQARVISVREAARLQSFPDAFIFAGTMNPAYRQIGNAVPPIMAREMGKVIMTSLKEVVDTNRLKVAAE
jgi:DNA (cytosine-5)-methyltransferase 1